LLTNKLKASNAKQKYWDTRLQNHFNSYTKNFKPVLFLDNHDIDRILYSLAGNIDKLLDGLQYMKNQGLPFCLYYGTEQGVSQEFSIKRKRPHADLEARRPINWNSLNKKLYSEVKKILTNQKGM